MKTCTVCGELFAETEIPTEPAVEMGAFLAREVYHDEGRVCLTCLANRGRLAMMYMRDYD
ncbi:MAG: hypothetical protein D6751_05320 [Deltaproteobacteria bacterium]|nr:MAG: hypothetical protein D6751_05320 [Deltaproteobacteria bacterium]